MSSQREETRVPGIDVRSCVKLSHQLSPKYQPGKELRCSLLITNECAFSDWTNKLGRAPSHIDQSAEKPSFLGSVLPHQYCLGPLV